MPQLVFYYFISAFLCHCRSFKPFLCLLSPLQLSYVMVAKGEGYLPSVSRISDHVNYFLSYHASRKNYSKILTILTTLRLSFDLSKSGVKVQEKRARSWCHNYIFLMSLLLVSNDINITEISKENQASRFVKIVNHSSPCYAQSHLLRLTWTQSRITLTI